ncbi:DUF4138 domain-containing protein [Croceitalea sp. MTPC6]
MALFFPSPIRQAVTGAEHFTFSYNKEAGQHFGLLQANRGNDSNLLVITEDGRVYSYHLEYHKELMENFRFVNTVESVGKEKETQVLDTIRKVPVVTSTKKTLDLDNPRKLMEKGAEYVLGRRTKVLKTKRKDGLALRLKELFYHGDEVYVEMEIHNRSAIDFEVDVLEVYRVNGKKGRRSSHQMVLLEPMLKYGFPEIVRVGQRHSFVYVLPKFTLGDAEKLMLELQEKKGSRILWLRWD